MKTVSCLVALGLILTFATAARASDPVGVYALIDKVVVEPSESAPERIQIWGTFSRANEKGGYTYSTPARGFFYYTLDKNRPDICKKEWADLKRIAGTGECIGFASSYRPDSFGKLRKPTDKVESPDLYPVAGGLFKVESTRPVVQRLKAAAERKSGGE